MKKLYLTLSAALLAGSAAWAQWSTNYEDPNKVFPTGTNSYATEVKMSTEGHTWAMVYHPNLEKAEGEEDISNVVYEYRVQCWDKNGVALFPAEGLLVSNYRNRSYTVVNNYLYADADGNAILCVSDWRNSNERGESYTVYKISPSGEMLWGDEGIALSDPLKPSTMVVGMNCTQITDGSYVFAWSEYDEGVSHVRMQRLNAEGKALWDTSKTIINDNETSYPYLVESGDNTVILVYASTPSQIIMARKLDFEGEKVWGKNDVRIYRGGFTVPALQTNLEVKPSGDGGVLVAWYDDRSSSNFEQAYFSYVTSDGKLAFSGASDEADVRLGYKEGVRCFNTSVTPSADGTCFYAVWRITSSYQTFQGIQIQKVSKTGELLWDEEGVELVPYEEQSLGYISSQAAPEGGFIAFYEIYYEYLNQQCFAQRLDSEAKNVWEPKQVKLSADQRQASSLNSAPIFNGSAWLFTYTDGGDMNAEKRETTYCMGILNPDGKLGLQSAGIAAASASDNSLCFDGSKTFTAEGADVVTVHTLSGSLAAQAQVLNGKASVDLAPGLYIASANGAAIKIIVK